MCTKKLIKNRNGRSYYFNDYWFQEDKKMFSKLKNEVFPESLITFLKNHNYDGIFLINEIENLIFSENKIHDYSFKFSFYKLQRLKTKLENSLHEFNHVLLMNVFESEVGELSICPELKITDSKFIKTKKLIQLSANVVCQKYYNIIKLGNNLFAENLGI